jgi:aspartate-semialdehyde dehydrogenase
MAHSSDSLRIAIVGASSLLGRELKEVLEDRNFPATDVSLLESSADAVGTLSEFGGEITFMRPLDEESFAGCRFAFFASGREATRQNVAAAARAGAVSIELSTGLNRPDENRPAAEADGTVVWIPALDRLLPPLRDARVMRDASSRVTYQAPCAPVIIACSLAAALAPHSPVRVALVFFVPVSEHGQAGVDELESQSAQLLSFLPPTRALFDAQVAFNLMSAYGQQSRLRLGEFRASIARQSAAYLAGRAVLPAIQLVAAPVFYGYAFSAFLEFAEPPRISDLQESLARASIRFVDSEFPDISNAGIAGQDEIQVGPMEPDASIPASLWLWGAADNLRLVASGAVRIAEVLLAS